MSDIAIQVEGIGKRYRIGRREKNQTFREAIMAAARAPFQRLRNSVNTGGDEAFWALKDVSFSVKRGEVVGVIGRNGAGKSTLLKILSRITEPTEGQAIINGRVGSLLEVGTGFHPELTGRENVYLNGAILGMKRGEIDKKFDEIVAFSEIEKFLDTPVKHYSSGMYMRLAFAVAAHLDPEILIVDEVLAVGDAAFQGKCLGKMKDVAGQGRTVLFVSHNMAAIENLCGSVVLLNRGCVRAVGHEVREIIEQYIFNDERRELTYEWLNPGAEFDNPWFKPLRMSLHDRRGGSLTMPASNSEPCFLRIEGEVQELDPNITVGIAVLTEKGDLLFRSFQTDGPPSEWSRLTKGRQAFEVKIPERLLNEGVCRLELLVARRHDKWLFCPGREGPAIFLTIRGGLSDSPEWIEPRPGLIAPVLTWGVSSQ